jgi:hypothetical protein
VARHAGDRPSAHSGTGDSVIWTVVDFAGAREETTGLCRSFHSEGECGRNPLTS